MLTMGFGSLLAKVGRWLVDIPVRELGVAVLIYLASEAGFR